MPSFRNCLAFIAGISLLAGCAGNGDEIKSSPLVKFTEERSITTLWSKNIGASFGDKYHQLTPAIVGGNVFVTDTEGQVSSYNVETGKLQWEIERDVAISSGVGVGEGVAVVATYAGDIIALSADKGEILWQVSVGGEVISPAQLNRKIVVVQLVSGDIVALDRLSGEQVWIYTSNQPNLTLRGTSSPLVAMDVTLVGLDNGKYVALDNNDGHLLWQQRINIAKGKSDIDRLTDIDGKAILYKKVIYIPSYRGNLTAINPFNAQVLWRKPYSSYRGLAAANNTLFLSSAQDVVHAVDTQTAAEIWRQDLLLNRLLSSPVTFQGMVVVGDKQGYLHFLSQDDGRFVARHKLSGAILGDMLVKNNTLFVLSNNGRLTAMRVK